VGNVFTSASRRTGAVWQAANTATSAPDVHIKAEGRITRRVGERLLLKNRREVVETLTARLTLVNTVDAERYIVVGQQVGRRSGSRAVRDASSGDARPSLDLHTLLITDDARLAS
jgi:hypothetical protein